MFIELLWKLGEKYSGVTVHYVNSAYDEGNIINQAIVELEQDETPESLSEKVQAVEKPQLISVIKDFIEKKESLTGIYQEK